MKLFLIVLLLPIFAYAQALENLVYEDAIRLLKKNNIELNIAEFEEKISSLEYESTQGLQYGSIDFTQSVIRSNDAGNVFGFKLQSREASFKDFGFDEFLSQMGGLPGNTNQLLATQPKQLNYPNARTHYQSALEYSLPLYTGGKISAYTEITKKLKRLSSLEKEKLLDQKILEVKKSYFDISLVNTYIDNLNIIKKNIEVLENVSQEMIKEGYAKRVDLLEIQAKKANVVRMPNQAKANKELLLHYLSFLLHQKVDSVYGTYKTTKALHVKNKEVLESNLDIQKAKLGLEISKKNVELNKASFLPQAGMFAQYAISNDELLSDIDRHDSYTLGVQVKWNLFNGGSDRAKLEKARVEQLKLVEQVKLAQSGILLKLARIQTEIQSYDFEIESLKKEVELARSIYENYLGRYQEKIVSINDVIIKQSEEIEKVLKLNELQNRRNEKILELEKLADGENSEKIM